MQNKNTNLWIGLGVILVLVVGVWYWSMNKSSLPGYNADDQKIESTEDTGDGVVNSNVPAASIAYRDALVKYKDARIQLDATCQASPDKGTFKNGTNIMIDNRAPVARTVKVGSTFTMKAYSFRIVNLSSATLPATWLVDCDKSQNVSTISIQK